MYPLRGILACGYGVLLFSAIGLWRFELLLSRLLPVGNRKAARATSEHTPGRNGECSTIEGWGSPMILCKMMRYGLLFLSVLGTAMLLADMPSRIWPGGVDVGIGMNVLTWFLAILFMAFVDCSAKEER
ncbi:MAG: hypothetical protein ACYDCW_02195 [Acidithiobacillus ferrivorans]